MNTTPFTTHFASPARAIGARPAPTAGAAPGAGWAARSGAALWRGLEAVGRARAHSHLMAFADRCEANDPALAREMRVAARQGPMS